MSAVASLANHYVNCTNGSDREGFLALFADDAVVEDAGRVFQGRDAIKNWSASDIFDAQVQLEVINRQERPEDVVLTTKVDGNFDRTGLPDPLLITQRITGRGGKITHLECRLVSEASGR